MRKPPSSTHESSYAGTSQAIACARWSLGCGAGDQFPTYRERFSSYIGIDVSRTMLEQFRAVASTPRLLCADMVRLPLRNAEFDLVFSNGVGQYLNPSDLGANHTEVRRVLAPRGAYLIANIPDAHLRLFYYARGALRSDVRASPGGGWRGVSAPRSGIVS